MSSEVRREGEAPAEPRFQAIRGLAGASPSRKLLAKPSFLQSTLITHRFLV